MKIKIFNIRLSIEYFQNDQDIVNKFLEMVEFKKTYTHFVSSDKDDYWSAVIFYKEKEIPEEVFLNIVNKSYKA